MNLEQAYRMCREKTRQEAKNFYYAFMLLPKAKREAIYVAYSFARECDDIVDEPSENKPEQLNVFRQKVSDCYKEGTEPSNELFLALKDVIQNFSIPEVYFQELIDGMEMDLHHTRYQTFEDLYQYCYRVASVVGLISIYIFRFSDDACIPYAVDLGIAMQLTNILRDLVEDANRDRIYLPLDELKEYQLSEEFLFQTRDPHSPEFQNLMKFQVERARDYFERSLPLLPYLEEDARVCPKILQKLYQEVLRKIENKQYNVFEKRVRLSSIEKVWLMLSTFCQKA